MDASTFSCSICGETSTHICVYCTKDACANHLCERCHRCSDCCACGAQVFNEEFADYSTDGHISEPHSPHETEPQS